jgi:hypothetical protein
MLFPKLWHMYDIGQKLFYKFYEMIFVEYNELPNYR